MAKHSRGKNWQVLKVKINVDGPKNGTKAGKLKAILKVLRGSQAPKGYKISRVWWSNPDADHTEQEIYPDNDFLFKKGGLETLNRGGWLETIFESQLENLTGERPKIRNKRGRKRESTLQPEKHSKGSGSNRNRVSRSKGKKSSRTRKNSKVRGRGR